jgi:uncharacterized protein YcfL
MSTGLVPTLLRSARSVVFAPTAAVLGLGLASAALLSAGGCHYSDAPVTARPEAYDVPWLLTTPPLRADTVVGEARPVYDENNLLHVTVPVRNVTGHNIPLQYKFVFYDRAGAEVNTYTGQTVIPPHGLAELRANATSPRAEGDRPFRLEMRYLEPYEPGAQVGT